MKIEFFIRFKCTCIPISIWLSLSIAIVRCLHICMYTLELIEFKHVFAIYERKYLALDDRICSASLLYLFHSLSLVWAPHIVSHNMWSA
jgi:hypothetical protein